MDTMNETEYNTKPEYITESDSGNESESKNESDSKTESDSKQCTKLILATATVSSLPQIRKPARTLTAKQSHLSNRLPEWVQRSRYMVSGYKTPQEESFFYATAVAYVNECWTNKTDVKNFNKRPVAQKKIIDKLIKGCAVIEPAFDLEFQHLEEIAVPGKYFKDAVVYKGYNNFWKYGDILGAILDVNIHVMENRIVPRRMIPFAQGCNVNRFSLVSVYDSYARERRPHLFLFNDVSTTTFHAITCVDNLMHHNFGYFQFCRDCFWTTFTTPMHKKKCNVVEADNQYWTQRKGCYFTSSKHDWRPHPDNVQGRVEEVFGTDVISFDETLARDGILEEAMSMNDVIFIGIDGNDELVSKKRKSVDDDDAELLSKEQKSETRDEGWFNCSCIDDEHLDCDHDRNAFEYADL